MRAFKITQITMMQGQYCFNWNLLSHSVCFCSCEESRVWQLNLYSDISFAADHQCLKAVYSKFVRNEGNMTRTHSSLCSWTGLSKEIANIVLFWLRLSETYVCRPIQVSCFFSSPIKAFGNGKLLTPSLLHSFLLAANLLSWTVLICIFWPRPECRTFLTRIGYRSRKKIYRARVRSPNSKIMNRRIIDFNILE